MGEGEGSRLERLHSAIQKSLTDCLIRGDLM